MIGFAIALNPYFLQPLTNETFFQQRGEKPFPKSKIKMALSIPRVPVELEKKKKIEFKSAGAFDLWEQFVKARAVASNRLFILFYFVFSHKKKRGYKSRRAAKSFNDDYL